MASFFNRLLTRLGIDRAIRNVLIGRTWTIMAGPVSVLMIGHFLTPIEQGYYFTFFSLQALQVFFELGAGMVIMQFASHEAAHLHWTDDKTMAGETGAKSRLAALFKFSLKWYAAAGIFASIALMIAGFWFFRRAEHAEVVEWQAPWVLLVAATILNLALTPFYCILEGCGRIAEVHGMLARQAIIGSLAFWICLCTGAGLYAIVAMPLAQLITVGAMLVRRYTRFFRDLWRRPADEHKISWRAEFLPMQWKIAVSWASGYLIFQLINPVLFRYHGPVAAGQYGMSQRIADSIQTTSYSWVSTKAAVFGSLLSTTRHRDLFALFLQSARQSIFIALAGSIVFLAAIILLRMSDVSLADRFLPTIGIACLCLNMLLNIFIFCVATLTRAEKREPFLIPSLVGAAVTPAIIFFVGIPYGASMLAAGLLAATSALGIPMTWRIYTKFRDRILDRRTFAQP